MGQYALLFVASAIFVGSIAISGMRSDANDADESLNLYHSKRLARETSISGYNIAVSKLLEVADESWADAAKFSSAHTSLDKGWFELTVTPVGGSGDTVDIVSTGHQNYIGRNGVGGDTTNIVDARWIRIGEPPAIPPAFGYAVIASDIDLMVGGGFELRSLDSTQNANIHTNGHLTDSGNNYYVEGYGTYTTSEDVQYDHFYPNDDWNGTDRNIFWADSVHLPRINMPRMRAEADWHVMTDLVIDGDTWAYTSWEDLGAALGRPAGVGTEDDPFILVVEGNLDVLNEVRMSGWGMFVSAGDLNIKGSQAGKKGVNNGFYGELSNNRTQSGIFAVGTVSLNAGVDVYGTVFGEAGLTSNGHTTIYGSLASPRTNFKGNGGAHVFYAGPNEAITDTYFIDDSVDGPRLIAYAEW